MSEENKKTASERLENLEATMAQVGQALSSLDPLIRDLGGLKDALKLLNNKVDAIVKALNAGQALTDDTLNKFMTANNEKELADKVATMINSGLLTASDTVTNDSFVVINEADPAGTVVNPRMQFLVSALQMEEVRNKLNGAKVGDNIAVGDKGGSINVLEAYTIVIPKAAEAAPSEDPAAATTEAPAASEAPAPSADAAPATDAAASTASTDATASTASTDSTAASA
jgi:hypothetical protein